MTPSMASERSVLFRVFDQYFDLIQSGQKDFEARPATHYWSKVAGRRPKVAVFISGRRVHRRRILAIESAQRPPEAVAYDANLMVSFRGRRALIFRLGEAIS